jgi:hypothetical protein
MTFSVISQRMEIFFWTGWISALRWIRVTRWLGAGLLASGCLVSLLLTGLFINARGQSDRQAGAGAPVQVGKQSLAAAEPPDRARPSQNNTLLLVVDQLEGSQAQLQGAWLLVMDPEGSNGIFLPIFPSSTTSTETPTQDLSRLFSLDGSGMPAAAFQEAVRQKNIRWAHILILEHASLAAMAELEGGVDLGHGLVSGGKAVTWLDSQDPGLPSLLERQAVLLGAICLQSSILFENAHIDLISGLLAGPRRSDLSLDEFQQGWKQAGKNGKFSCEFPTIWGGK